MITKDGTTCFHHIREKTKNEYVAVGSDGNILRWGATGGDEQKWLIYPAGGGKYKIQSVRDGKFMAAGSNGNILVWDDTGGEEQEFVFNQQQRDGWLCIQEGTRGEHFGEPNAKDHKSRRLDDRRQVIQNQ